MSQSANDLRVTRSQRFIREALIDLIEERGFDALSVGEITARAMVSRATFYRHYRDKYDLVEQIYAEAMQALFGAIAVQQTVHSPQMIMLLNMTGCMARCLARKVVPDSCARCEPP